MDAPDNEIARELSPGEQLLWEGYPPLGFRLYASDALIIPFSLVWGGMAVYSWAWEMNIGTSFLAQLMTLPFVVVGFYLLIGRFFVDKWQRECTVYAVTNERLIIVYGLLRRNVKSYNLETLSDFSFNDYGGGKGLIIFGHGWMYDRVHFWVQAGMGVQGMAPSLDLSENAREVYALIREAQRAARRSEANIVREAAMGVQPPRRHDEGIRDLGEPNR